MILIVNLTTLIPLHATRTTYSCRNRFAHHPYLCTIHTTTFPTYSCLTFAPPAQLVAGAGEALPGHTIGVIESLLRRFRKRVRVVFAGLPVRRFVAICPDLGCVVLLGCGFGPQAYAPPSDGKLGETGRVGVGVVAFLSSGCGLHGRCFVCCRNLRRKRTNTNGPPPYQHRATFRLLSRGLCRTRCASDMALLCIRQDSANLTGHGLCIRRDTVTLVCNRSETGPMRISQPVPAPRNPRRCRLLRGVCCGLDDCPTVLWNCIVLLVEYGDDALDPLFGAWNHPGGDPR